MIHGRHNNVPINIKSMLLGAIALLFVLLCANVYRQLGYNYFYWVISLIACITAYCLIIFLNCRFNKTFLGNVFLWMIFCTLIYSGIAIHAGSFGGLRYPILIVLFGFLLPFFVQSLFLGDSIETFTRYFVNIMGVLALTSVILWVAGPLLGLLSPNCLIENRWNGNGRLEMSPGYYWLLFETQIIDFGFGYIPRNTSIFVEAPSFALPLCVALHFELFFSKVPRKKMLVILSLATLSSTSTIGIVVYIIDYSILFIERKKATGVQQPYRMVAIAVVLIAALFAALQVIDLRNSTSASGAVRLDDFRAGFIAWSNSPLFGYGFGNMDAVIANMSEFRSANQGTSNSLTQILSFGGIALLVPFTISLSKVATNSRWSVRMMFFGFLFEWLFSGIWATPIALLLCSFGVVDLCNSAIQKDSAYRRRSRETKIS